VEGGQAKLWKRVLDRRGPRLHSASIRRKIAPGLPRFPSAAPFIAPASELIWRRNGLLVGGAAQAWRNLSHGDCSRLALHLRPANPSQAASRARDRRTRAMWRLSRHSLNGGWSNACGSNLIERRRAKTHPKEMALSFLASPRRCDVYSGKALSVVFVRIFSWIET
jgi:hypothetical protein